MSAVGLIADDGITSEDVLARPIKDRIAQAREDRKKLEPVWHSNLAFAAGKYWLKWDRDQRKLVMPPDLWPRDLYSADVITEYRTTALGELSSDDDRPELLLRREDEASEDFQRQLNKAVAFGWDHEWKADEALEIARRMCIDLGTSAIQCQFDPTVGPMAGEVPHVDGRPVYDTSEQAQLVDQFGQEGPIPGVKMKAVREGRICWRPLSCLSLLIPPGIPDEGSFPWECVVRPVPLASVKQQYPDTAAELKEDSDIGSLLGIDIGSETHSTLGSPMNDGKPGRVRDHVWLFTYFEKPTEKFPNGRVVTLAGNKMKILHIEPRLPYQAPDGTYRSGIAYFHWWRVTGRFFSRGLVDVMKDVQRAVNSTRTTQREIISRGLPYVLVEEGSNMEARKGVPLEIIPIKRQGTGQPVVSPGIGPGGWMSQELEELRADLEHATGIHGPRLGLNPTNVTTYGQLALVSENDQTKRQHIYRQHKLAIARLIEDSVYDMRTYWGPQKQIDLAGDEGRIDASVFNATKIPTFFMVRVARGSARPRTQAGELTKVEQLWQAALNSQIVITNPQAWIDWYSASLEAGQSLELPSTGADAQTQKARIVAHQLMEGAPVQPQYYDQPQVFIPILREAQIQAEFSDQGAWQRIEAFIQQMLQLAQQNAQQMGGALGAGSPVPGPEMQQQPDPQAEAEAAAQQQQAEMDRQKQEVEMQQKVAQEQRAHEMHQHQVRKLKAEADLAEKTAKQGPQQKGESRGESKKSDKSDKSEKPTEVHVHPNIHVSVPSKPEHDKEVEFKRGKDGRIESAEVKDKKKRGK